MSKKPNFGGWATKINLKCADGRTVRDGAFAHQDGARVPLVWQHQHGDIGAVLGHAILHNRPGEGTYADCYLNGTSQGKDAQECVAHGDVTQLSIWANNLKQTETGDVLHGNIREVSLVLSGANPGAVIEFPTVAHSDDVCYDEAHIFTGLPLDVSGAMSHSDADPGDGDKKPEADKTGDDKKDPKPEDKDPAPAEGDNHDDPEGTAAHSATGGKTVKHIYDAMTPEQKEAVGLLIEEASSRGGSSVQHSDITGGKNMPHNVFEPVSKETVAATLTHDQMSTIIQDAKSHGSLRDSFLAHAQEYGIENIEYLFPDARTVSGQPDFIMRDQDWVSDVMDNTHHSPFSRIKSIHADITADEARARGYIKGKLKKEEVFTLLKRTTTPQTIYKKQKLDRDDIIDIVDFNVVAWLKTEMRMMLNEEIARAILIGDGRLSDDDDKISEAHVRPIVNDTVHDLYAIRNTIKVDQSANEDAIAKAFIRGAIKARKNYKGSGNPTLYTTEDLLTDMLLLEDGLGHSLYKTEQELATKLRVKKIVTVPVMEGYKRTTEDGRAYPLLGIIVNLRDYTVGADKGGAISMFEDFDIDYNQEKYLIETRISGALTKPKSALVFELDNGTSAPADSGDEGSPIED